MGRAASTSPRVSVMHEARVQAHVAFVVDLAHAATQTALRGPGLPLETVGLSGQITGTYWD